MVTKEDPYHSVRLKPEVWWELEEYRRALEMARFSESRDPRRLSVSEAVEALLQDPEVREKLARVRQRTRAPVL